jgi:hypothetical protein
MCGVLSKTVNLRFLFFWVKLHQLPPDALFYQKKGVYVSSCEADLRLQFRQCARQNDLEDSWGDGLRRGGRAELEMACM